MKLNRFNLEKIGIAKINIVLSIEKLHHFYDTQTTEAKKMQLTSAICHVNCQRFYQITYIVKSLQNIIFIWLE